MFEIINKVENVCNSIIQYFAGMGIFTFDKFFHCSVTATFKPFFNLITKFDIYKISKIKQNVE